MTVVGDFEMECVAETRFHYNVGNYIDTDGPFHSHSFLAAPQGADDDGGRQCALAQSDDTFICSGFHSAVMDRERTNEYHRHGQSFNRTLVRDEMHSVRLRLYGHQLIGLLHILILFSYCATVAVTDGRTAGRGQPGHRVANSEINIMIIFHEHN